MPFMHRKDIKDVEDERSQQCHRSQTPEIIGGIEKKENEILNSVNDLDHHQNVINCSSGHFPPLVKMSLRSISNFLSYPGHNYINKLTNTCKET